MADQKRFTWEQKLKCVERELRFRRRVYKGRVSRGAMKKEDCDFEIAVMESIRDDIQAAIDFQRPTLF